MPSKAIQKSELKNEESAELFCKAIYGDLWMGSSVIHAYRIEEQDSCTYEIIEVVPEIEIESGTKCSIFVDEGVLGAAVFLIGDYETALKKSNEEHISEEAAFQIAFQAVVSDYYQDTTPVLVNNAYRAEAKTFQGRTY